MPNSHLFKPLNIRKTTIRNRIWVSPMCQYSVDEHDGVPHDWHLVNLGQTAAGGAGLVFTEATAVSPEGRITSEDTGIWNEDQAQAWARVVKFLHSQGASAGIQLSHAGRKGSDYKLFTDKCGTTKPVSEGGWETVAPSPLAYPGFDIPKELDWEGIDKVVDDFAAAAQRSRESGFDVVEIHAAHGYLIHQFLSPLSNERTDDYGGSLENRSRLLLRIIAAVREAIGEEMALFVRFSATDWTEGGWDEHQNATVAAWCREAGADFFDISSGGIINGIFISVEPGYQVPLAEHVGRHGEVDVAAVGLITTPAQAEEIVASGRAEAVMLGREMIRDPHFALRAAHELGEEIDYWTRQYRGAVYQTAVLAESSRGGE
ncbi:NADH:flavin oxidoreductase/NADH oxidase [Arthrobacter sp. NPDC056727]|uniref:NADH:flavin oxidoreductase/NADH oxidase n=1 Tax=Arthrobacter sp. NPDC056727 TaxID=3345927 RepID=UPI0036701110